MKIRTLFTENRPLFIPFIMAGHPTLDATANAILGLSECGADMIELGVPFSDPIADGPINQQAAEIALQNGVTLAWCLSVVNTVKQSGCKTPIILFSYFNPILHMGIEHFIQKASQVGVDGVLIVDLPIEESLAFRMALASSSIEMVILASPTTHPERLKNIQKINPAFVYYISRLGVTGVQQDLTKNLQQAVCALKQVMPLPICVGFGISKSDQAKQVATFSDGVIVGSSLVKTLQNTYADLGLHPFLTLAKQFAETIHHARLL